MKQANNMTDQGQRKADRHFVADLNRLNSVKPGAVEWVVDDDTPLQSLSEYEANNPQLFVPRPGILSATVKAEPSSDWKELL